MNMLEMTRRQLLRCGSAAGVLSLSPGFAYANSDYGFTHGEFQISVLSDGFITLPGEILVPDVSTQERADILARVDAPGGIVRARTNIPLIRKGDDLILVDIGAGRKYQSSDGDLTDNLKAAKIDPADVTKIVFTHCHPDHIWATVAEDGSLRFPNATYYVGAAEWNFWMDPDYLTSMPKGLHDFAKGAQRDLGAVRDRIVMLQPGDDVVAGMGVLDTPGHTPGHLSLELAGPEELIITADVANNEIISFEHPDWTFGYDTDPELAIQTRRRLLDRAAADRVKLLGYHWQYPGVGYVERKGTAFRFLGAT